MNEMMDRILNIVITIIAWVATFLMGGLIETMVEDTITYGFSFIGVAFWAIVVTALIALTSVVTFTLIDEING